MQNARSDAFRELMNEDTATYLAVYQNTMLDKSKNDNLREAEDWETRMGSVIKLYELL